MVDGDKQAFSSLVQALGAAFNREITQALLLGYWLGLKDLELSAVEKATGQALRTSRFMPSPAELRELAGDEPVAARAVRAWEAVITAIRGNGAYRSVEFMDPAVNATIRSLGGWVRLCGSESEELHKWTRREFTKIYEQYAQYGVHGDAGAYLPGLHEADNRAKGYEIPAPVRIALPAASDPRLELPEMDDEGEAA